MKQSHFTHKLKKASQVAGALVFTVTVVFAGDGSPASFREGEEHRSVQLQHPAAGEAARSVQSAPCCQPGAEHAAALLNTSVLPL